MSFQPSLDGFDSSPNRCDSAVAPPGLTYVSNYLTAEEENDLLRRIEHDEAQRWLPDLSRRVQHYGYRYDYKARSISRDMKLGPLPHWLSSLGDRLVHERLIERCPEQVIVNEYLPGQGIARHIDCVPCFGPTLITISLRSDCVMDFEHPSTAERYEILLEKRSLASLTGDARYVWRHGVAKRHTDRPADRIVRRQRRISLTFRTVVL
jgi:alkylated DNA repair dioxygenase AlkB